MPNAPLSNHFHLKDRLKAFALHGLASLLTLGLLVFYVRHFWYPDVFFALEDAWQGLYLLFAITVILGPFLTGLLYVPGKRGVKLDLVLVLVMQLLGLFYGTHIIYQQRPAALVWAADRFEVIPASQLDTGQLPAEFFPPNERHFPFTAYALPAQTREEINEFVLNNVAYQKMPDRYRPLGLFLDTIRTESLDPEKISPATNPSRRAWHAFRERHPQWKSLLYFPLEGTTTDWNIIVLHPKTGETLGYLPIDAWLEYPRPSNASH